MAKPRTYGMRATSPKMSRELERCFWKPAREQMQRRRQRESTTRKPVAAQIVKEKEATE